MASQSILITGATSGIGQALAHYYKQHRAQVVVIGRNLAQLEAMSEQGFITFACDLTKADEVFALAEQLEKMSLSFSLVILAAGGCYYTDPTHFSASVVNKNMQINFTSVVNSVEALMPRLTRYQSSKPCLAIVGSLAMYLPFTRAQGYGASKAAVAYFADSLRVDYRHRMDVCLIEPGFVETPLTQKNTFNMPTKISVEQAVKSIVRGLEQRKMHIAFPRRLAWPLKLLHCCPAFIRDFIGRKLAAKQ